MKYIILKKDYYVNKINYYLINIFKVNLKIGFLFLPIIFVKYFLLNLLLFSIYRKTNNIFLFYNIFITMNIFKNVFDDRMIDQQLIWSLNIKKKYYYNSLIIFENLFLFIVNFISLLLIGFDIVSTILLALMSCQSFMKFINKKLIILLSIFLLSLTIFQIYIYNLVFPVSIVIGLNIIFYFLINNKIVKNLAIDKNKLIIKKNNMGLNLLSIFRNIKKFNIFFIELLITFLIFGLLIYFCNQNIILYNSTHDFLNNNIIFLFLIILLLNQTISFKIFDECDKKLSVFSFYKKNKKVYLKERIIINILINIIPILILSIFLLLLKINILYIVLIIILNIFISLMNMIIYLKNGIEKFNIIYVALYMIILIITII